MSFDKLIVLGTGNAMATKCFNTCFALKSGYEYLLVDTGGGNGILSALEKAKIDPAKIHHLFLTHAHTDHILGFPWILRRIGTLMKNGEYKGELTVYGHDEVLSAAKTICELTVQEKFTDLFNSRIKLTEVKDGDSIDILGSHIEFFDILSTKAKQFGMTAALNSGKRLAFAGDEPCAPQCEKFAVDADWLFCEAFCLYDDRERFKPYEKHHSTAADAAKLAQRLNAKNLVAWHTEDKTLDSRKERYLAEIARHFSGRAFVPYDQEQIEL